MTEWIRTWSERTSNGTDFANTSEYHWQPSQLQRTQRIYNLTFCPNPVFRQFSNSTRSQSWRCCSNPINPSVCLWRRTAKIVTERCLDLNVSVRYESAIPLSEGSEVFRSICCISSQSWVCRKQQERSQKKCSCDFRENVEFEVRNVKIKQIK